MGDWLVIVCSSIIVILLFQLLWVHTPATKLRIRLQNSVYGEFSLNQNKQLQIQGKLGVTLIQIQNGQARFVQSPCNNQYCVHQGWLKTAGQASICLPNQISLELLDGNKTYDSLNY